MNSSKKKRPARRKKSTASKKPVPKEPMPSPSSTSVMDPEVWGTLQHHINLAENVYMRLPLTEFFQLRGVCKEWNRLAEPRLCPTQRLHKPYFAIAHPVTTPFIPYHAGVLTLNVASGHWKWNQLPFESNQLSPLCQPFAVKGVVLGARNDIFKICDVHRKRCIGCIYLPADDNRHQVEMERFRALAMAVDTSVVPHTFKLILGGPTTKTIVYDSAATDSSKATGFRHVWEKRSSLMQTTPSKRWAIKSCINSPCDVYMWSQMDKILVYSLTEDMWSELHPPLQATEADSVEGALGYWDGRVFVAMADERSCFALWELVSRSEQSWRKVACIPAELQSWLMPKTDGGRTVFASFCDEHVLLHTLLRKEAKKTGVGKHFVLFNLETKAWEKHRVGSYGVEPKRRQ